MSISCDGEANYRIISIDRTPKTWRLITMSPCSFLKLSKMTITGWWFFATPLKNDGVRQLGWWLFPIWMGTCQIDGNQTTNQFQTDEDKTSVNLVMFLGPCSTVSKDAKSTVSLVTPGARRCYEQGAPQKTSLFQGYMLSMSKQECMASCAEVELNRLAAFRWDSDCCFGAIHNSGTSRRFRIRSAVVIRMDLRFVQRLDRAW